MEEWTMDEIRNKDLMAPCGLYCGVCGIYIATRDLNEEFKTMITNLYRTKLEDTECMGCMQPDPPKKLYNFCKICKIRDCVRSQGYYSCHQCKEWPCTMIENFELAGGSRVMKRAIPIWRSKVAKYGDEDGSVEWAKAECKRYHCSACGKPVFMFAQHCITCRTRLADELDGQL